MNALTVTMKGTLTCQCGGKAEVDVRATTIGIDMCAGDHISGLLQAVYDAPKGWLWSRHYRSLQCPSCRGCLRCLAQSVAAQEWGFSGVSRYDRSDFHSDYECVLEQIAAELVVARREENI